MAAKSTSEGAEGSSHGDASREQSLGPSLGKRSRAETDKLDQVGCPTFRWTDLEDAREEVKALKIDLEESKAKASKAEQEAERMKAQIDEMATQIMDKQLRINEAAAVLRQICQPDDSAVQMFEAAATQCGDKGGDGDATEDDGNDAKLVVVPGTVVSVEEAAQQQGSETEEDSEHEVFVISDDDSLPKICDCRDRKSVTVVTENWRREQASKIGGESKRRKLEERASKPQPTTAPTIVALASKTTTVSPILYPLLRRKLEERASKPQPTTAPTIVALAPLGTKGTTYGRV